MRGNYEKVDLQNSINPSRIQEGRSIMSKVLVGVFVAIFIGAVAYEFMNRTKPDLAEKFEQRISDGLSSILSPTAAKV